MTFARTATLLAASAVLGVAQTASAPAPWAIGPVQLSGTIDGYYNYTPVLVVVVLRSRGDREFRRDLKLCGSGNGNPVVAADNGVPLISIVELNV